MTNRTLLALYGVAALVLAGMENLFRPAYLLFLGVVALGIFGYSKLFIPAGFFAYPYGIAYFLAPGAALAAWVFQAARGRLRFDWKWALLSGFAALLLWEGVAKGAASIITQATGEPYAQTFLLEKTIARATRNNLISARTCPQRLRGEALRTTLPQYLCLKDTDYEKFGDGFRQVRLHGRIGWLGRSIDRYTLPDDGEAASHLVDAE